MIVLIAALCRDGAISLPWPWGVLKQDMIAFRRVTTAVDPLTAMQDLLAAPEADIRRPITDRNAIIIGRRTYESLTYPLPDRQHVLVSTTAEPPNLGPPGVTVCPSLGTALDAALITHQAPHAFLCGGRRLYQEALDGLDVNALWLTHIDAVHPDATVRFPLLGLTDWREVARSPDVHEPGKPLYHFSRYLPRT